MDTASQLFFIYMWVAIINMIAFAGLWKKTRVPLYRDFSLMWFSTIFGLTVNAFAADKSHFIKAIFFSAFYVHSLVLSLILAKLINVKFKTKYFNIIFIFAVATAFFIKVKLSSNPIYFALPIAIAMSLPMLLLSMRAIKRTWKKGSIPTKGFSLIILITALHLWDFPFLYYKPEAVTLGFSFGVILEITFVIFCIAFVVENTTIEKTKLKMEIAYFDVLTQDAKMKALGEMASGVAHEVNNPLAVMKLTIKHMQMLIDEKDGEDLNIFKKDLLAIDKQVDKTSFIVRSLLEFSHEDDLSPMHDTDINEIIDKTIVLFKEKCKSQGIELNVFKHPDTLNIHCHPAQISQALLNILQNSYDAIAKLNINKWIELKVHKSDKMVNIIITDSGIGIQSDSRTRIFQPFYTTKESVEGVGLGLSVARGIALLHKGSLELDHSHTYTRFILRLPLV